MKIDHVSGHSLVLREFDRIRGMFHHLGGSAGKFGDERLAKHMSQRQINHLRRLLQACADEQGGEISSRQRAAQLGELYLSLDDAGKRDFLHLLVTDFGPARVGVDAALQAWQEADSTQQRRDAEAGLRRAIASPRLRILTQFNALPKGVHFLIGMRADLLRFLPDQAELALLDEEMHALLSSWFDVGFLSLARITWDSPASLLEKLIAYESVHEIRSWTDLRNRLDRDRRCYAFFHPRMPDEPLIFVEVALLKHLADNVQQLLDESGPTLPPAKADTAIFYSISSTQPGLRGVPLGNFLIKRVVEALTADFPRLKLFSTLSPIPLFRRWMDGRLAESGERLFGARERAALVNASGIGDAPAALRALLERADWHADPAIAAVLARPLTRLCAEYLVAAKSGREPYDPVARFHLGNGARIERLNWLADTSSKGLRQSAGMMVNYLYDLPEIEANHEAYAEDGRVTTSAGLRRHLRKR